MHSTLIEPETAEAKPVNRHVRTNYRIRSGSFVMGFGIVAAHIVGQDYGLWTWVALGLVFFVYPQLLYWYTKRAPSPIKAEYRNLQIDPILLGFWCGALGFPLWLTFSLFNCVLINVLYYRAMGSALRAGAGFFASAGLGFWWFDARFEPHTDLPVSLLCIIGLTLYLIVATSSAYARSLKLSDIRAKLRLSQQALQQQIEEIHVLQSQLREQASRDPLTGLYNRRYLDATMERELARAKREGQPLNLILIDIDHFKQVNDTYGHQAGDEVLRQVARQLSDSARAADLVCRYGGEEFLLLLPGMPLTVALERAEQWRAASEAAIIAFGAFRIQVTLSLGIATYPGHGTSPEELIRHADQALYCAKAQGRNCVVVFNNESVMVPI
jgi:diguanylate cyclase